MSVEVEPNSDAALLGEIETLLASRRRRLRFAPWLERRFEAETGPRYAQILAADLRRTAIYYNLMGFGDLLLTPDTVGVAVALHVLVVTPAMLLVASACRRLTPLARDIGAASVPLLISAQILFIFALSASWSVSHYLFFVALNVATFNTSMRMRARAATWATYAIFLILPLTLAATQKIPIQLAAMQVISLFVCGLITLRGVADREREFRRSYLNGLRDQLRIAASDAEANMDSMTGAANRRGLESVARAVWSEVDGAAPVAVILFDVDRFKAYNDIYGHLAGDLCLKKIAAASREALRGRDAVLARYGGEEFLVLLTGPAAQEAAGIAEELRRAVLALNVFHAGALDRRIVSASFGVASGRVADAGFEALVAAADAALYGAKSAGRNQVNCALAA